MNDVFITGIIFGTIYGLVNLFIRRKERMALLNAGADPKMFDPQRTSHMPLRWGLMFIGVGFGILLGNYLQAYTMMDQEAAYFSLMLLFGGISLVIGHYWGIKLDKEETERLKNVSQQKLDEDVVVE